jgi:nitrogenase molybdenum-iron protein alpha/beta subunit
MTITNNNNIKDDFSQEVVYPYLFGVYLAINSVKGVYLLVDGPKCSQSKIEYIYPNHDINSDLINPWKIPRILSTLTGPDTCFQDVEKNIFDKVSFLLKNENPCLTLLNPMPHTTIISTDYERILKSISKNTKFKYGILTNNSLTSDWLDGYIDTLEIISQKMELKKKVKKKKKILIIGNPFYRNEYDFLGNVNELNKLFEEIGVEIYIWPQGNHLKDDEFNFTDASIIIALPHGIKSAKIISQKLNISYIELPLPFGITATNYFLRKIGEILDYSKKINNIIRKNNDLIYSRTVKYISAITSGTKSIVIIDPLLEPYIEDILKTCGIGISEIIHTSKYINKNRIKSTKYIKRKINKFFSKENANLLISPNLSPFYLYIRGYYFEFGFPNYRNHYLIETPFLGYNGFLFFIQQIVNTILLNKIKGERVYVK